MKTQQIKQLIRQDYVGKPSAETEARLQQAFMQRSASYRIRENSFAGFGAWLFSTKQLATKLTIACLLIGFWAVRPAFNLNPHLPVAADSTRVDQSRVLDSAMLNFSGDTTTKRSFLR